MHERQQKYIRKSQEKHQEKAGKGRIIQNKYKTLQENTSKLHDQYMKKARQMQDKGMTMHADNAGASRA